jgi:hypothetical protein
VLHKYADWPIYSEDNPGGPNPHFNPNVDDFEPDVVIRVNTEGDSPERAKRLEDAVQAIIGVLKPITAKSKQASIDDPKRCDLYQGRQEEGPCTFTQNKPGKAPTQARPIACYPVAAPQLFTSVDKRLLLSMSTLILWLYPRLF